MTSNNRYSDNLTNWSHISPNLLESWINERDQSTKKLIIIDSRSSTEYNYRHIKNALNISYSKIMRRRLLADKISLNELLVKNSNGNFIDYQECNVVVYDNQSEHSNQLENDSFTIILLNKLIQKFKSVSFLSGGFVAFNSKYSSLCIQSQPSQISPIQLVGITSPTSSNASSTSDSLTGTPISFAPISSAPPISELKNIIQLNRYTSTISDNIDNHNTFDTHLNKLDSPVIDLLTMREPTQILDFLYLGSQEDALSEITMKALNITNVLNVSQTCPKPEFIYDANFLRIPVNDGHAARIKPFFDIAFRFIEKCRKNNKKVLIHCLAGISRSPTLAIAYLMKYMNLKSDEAYKFVKERRTTISPNFNFLGQLYEYEKELNVKTSSGMINQNEESESAGIAFLKIRQKIQVDEPEINQAEIKFSPPKFQRKKTFVFKPLLNDPSAKSPVQNQETLCLIPPSSVQPLSLQSPSTALATFELNSPTSIKTSEISDLTNKFMPKSFTMDTIKDFKNLITEVPKEQASKDQSKPKFSVQMRRPTCFLGNLSQSPKSTFQTEQSKLVEEEEIIKPKSPNSPKRLKRPSSIFSGLNQESPGVFSNSSVFEIETINPKSSQSIQYHIEGTETGITESDMKNKSSLYHKPITTTSMLLRSNGSACTGLILERTYSNNSAGSSASSCSCCSNISNSSSSSTVQCQICQNNQYSQESYKKIKLSPLKDRHSIISLFTPSFPSNESKDTNVMDISCIKSEKNQEQTVHLPSASILFSNSQVVTRNESVTTPIHINATLPNILNSFSSKMNESRSFETLKTLLIDEQMKNSTNEKLLKYSSKKSNENNYESDENSEATASENDENVNEDDSLENNKRRKKSTSLLNSLANNILPNSGTNKSSSSSSKTGSNKNSLNGSIETMISVS